MAYRAATPFPEQFLDANGNAISGGTVYFYLTGTSTPATVYSDSAGTSLGTSVTLNSRGEPQTSGGTACTIYYDDAVTYKIVRKDAAGATVAPTVDPFTVSVTSAAVTTAGTTTARILSERFKDIVNVKDNGAVSGGVTDATTAIQATVTDFELIYIDAIYKTTTKITVPASTKIFGNGRTGRIDAWGVDAFEIAGASGDGVTIEGIAISSYSAVGAADPRLYSAIYCHGISGSTVNHFTGRDLYLQGWNTGVNWSYTVSSNLDNVYTVNCEYGLVYFGQSFNCQVSDCNLVCNAGQASIKLTPDGAIVGEGLMITNCLLASGAYGVDSGTGFFSLQITNCIIDSIGNTGINLTDCKDLKISNCFIYAASKGINFAALGSAVNQNIEIYGNSIKMSGSTGTAIDIANNNYGIAVFDNDFELSGTEIGVQSDGRYIDITHNYFVNSGSGASIDIQSNIAYHNINSNRGTIIYGGGWGTWTPTDGSGAALSLTVTSATYETYGDLVMLYGDITYPATANGSNSAIGGLPFTTTNPCTGSLTFGYKTIAALDTAIVGDNSTLIYPYDSTGNRITNATLSTLRTRFSATYKRAWA